MISIAIDGPSGAGKSTVAKAISQKLSFIYVDTGALYRALGYFVKKSNIDTANESMIVAALPRVDIRMEYIGGEQRIFLDNKDVSQCIRTPDISMLASKVSAIAEVRAFLLDFQRNMAIENNVIMDGRDIGTVVLPNADVKIFLTASVEERAARRHKELLEKGVNCTYGEVLKDMIERDYNDSTRKNAPLRLAKDAILVDTNDRTLEESINAVLTAINSKLNATAGEGPSL